MQRWLEQLVVARAEGRCEYCLQPAHTSDIPFPIDHVKAVQHGGATDAENLALACPNCNFRKGTNLTGIDPLSGQVTDLFNPRRDRWREHFSWVGHRIVGRTQVGRTTIATLALNSDERLKLRAAQPLPPTA
jgi:hypothetical protein